MCQRIIVLLAAILIGASVMAQASPQPPSTMLGMAAGCGAGGGILLYICRAMPRMAISPLLVTSRRDWA